MGCFSSVPSKSYGLQGGLNSDNGGMVDAKNLRVKTVANLLFHHYLRLVLLGDSGVGESCIVLRFVCGNSRSFLSQTVALQDSTIVKFEIWNSAGQERNGPLKLVVYLFLLFLIANFIIIDSWDYMTRYAALAPLYYRGVAVAVVVYDITSPESFTKAQYWVKELQKHGSPDIVMALVGNKADLQEKRVPQVSDSQTGF
ncbi:hypothetical protein Vadar_028403 [Vaccinium darrowii]|uniref:Uncharacterized protein n=1 Tax=Vaccinium darrowii TaxID=229202 RepID=A0ACB7ZFW2_9ERIC|nr:hypothetical protein Vadar_028403 [Vaccinium darrowii]